VRREPDPTPEVLIVGAGPTGLTLAVQLARWGVRHRLIDRAPAPAGASRAIGVQPRTLLHFAGMGVVEGALAAGSIPGAANVYDRERRLMRLSLRAARGDGPYRFLLTVSQGDVERLLTDRLQALGGGVERSRELVGLRQDEAGVTATLAGGERVRARWLVGCDGAHSAVRRLLDVGFEGRTYAERFLLADVEMDWPLAPDETHAWLHPEGLLACLPLPGRGRWRLLATDPPDGGAPGLERWRDLVAARTDQPRAAVRECRWTSDFRVGRRLVRRYRVGSALLAGDAAHIHSPLAGQGMNTGIQDACNLAWKLALVCRGRSLPGLLDTYQEERLPVARRVAGSTDSGTRLLVSRNPLLRTLRDHALLPLLTLDPVQARMLEQTFELGISYRDRSLSRSHGRGGPRAGDLAPGGIEGPGFTLLAFGEEAARAGRAAAPAWDGLLEVRPVTEPALLDAYRGGGSALYVVRPDGYVGLRCRPASARRLEEYRRLVLNGP
jgi:2-polyprenyl-6-methoxyphenol hydroxylase-like FAD-dependent oxidoreductase